MSIGGRIHLLNNVVFQFQKVRLWEIQISHLELLLLMFQFQKVRLWVVLLACGLYFCAFQFQKVRLWARPAMPTMCLKPLFQFQKVRLWAKCFVRFTGIKPDFNSKRCDYEQNIVGVWRRDCLFQFQKVRLWDVGKAHKAAIGQRFQFQKVRLWEGERDFENDFTVYFNSKRCDYEDGEPGRTQRVVKFQFQKVRLWAKPPLIVKFCNPIFQFQKVRLWDPMSRSTRSLLAFQFQKVRLWAINQQFDTCPLLFQFQKVRLWESVSAIPSDLKYLFQFQKVRLWASPYAILALNEIYFNSKRCDYETNWARWQNAAFIFQFQKVRLWD